MLVPRLRFNSQSELIVVWFFMLALQKHRIRDIIAKIHGQKCVTTEPFAGISDGSHT